MKQRLLSFVSRPPIREPGAQWLCQSCLAKASKRSISSTAPSLHPTALSSDTSSAIVSSPTQAFDADVVDRFADLREIKLPHRLPPQLLVHVDPIALNDQERREREHLYKWAMAGHVNADFQPKQETVRQIKGVVVSAGKMNRTVKVRVPGQRFEKHVKKVSFNRLWPHCGYANTDNGLVLCNIHKSSDPRSKQFSERGRRRYSTSPPCIEVGEAHCCLDRCTLWHTTARASTNSDTRRSPTRLQGEAHQEIGLQDATRSSSSWQSQGTERAQWTETRAGTQVDRVHDTTSNKLQDLLDAKTSPKACTQAEEICDKIKG